MTPLGLRSRSRAALRRLTVRADSNFQFSFAFVSPEQARAIRQVYNFCRAVDDVVDERAPGEAGRVAAAEQLRSWRQRLEHIYTGRPGPADTELSTTLVAHEVARAPLDEIISGCEMDLHHEVYENVAQVELYAYRVASCVGFALLPIFGDTSDAARRFAHHLGLAMQFTNMLRDVGEDAAQGRIYLPRNLMRSAGVSVEDLQRGSWSPAFALLARRFAAIAREHYGRAWDALASCQRRKLAGAEIMGRTYERLLDRIEDEDWDVFTRRLGLKRREKLAIAARVLSRPF